MPARHSVGRRACSPQRCPRDASVCCQRNPSQSDWPFIIRPTHTRWAGKLIYAANLWRAHLRSVRWLRTSGYLLNVPNPLANKVMCWDHGAVRRCVSLHVDPDCLDAVSGSLICRPGPLMTYGYSDGWLPVNGERELMSSSMAGSRKGYPTPLVLCARRRTPPAVYRCRNWAKGVKE
jgi:hypothetical protein